MNLPIDVVPGSHPLKFRWQGRVMTPFGPRTVDHEGPLAPAVEAAVASLITQTKQFARERDELQAFKDWVHAYLDGKDVPACPAGPHSAEGCRIGDRMDWVFAQLEELRNQQTRADAVEGAAEPMGRIVEERAAPRQPQPPARPPGKGRR